MSSVAFLKVLDIAMGHRWHYPRIFLLIPHTQSIPQVTSLWTFTPILITLLNFQHFILCPYPIPFQQFSGGDSAFAAMFWKHVCTHVHMHLCSLSLLSLRTNFCTHRTTENMLKMGSTYSFGKIGNWKGMKAGSGAQSRIGEKYQSGLSSLGRFMTSAYRSLTS